MRWLIRCLVVGLGLPAAGWGLPSTANYTIFSAGQVLTHSALNSLQSHYTTANNAIRAYFPGTDSLKVPYVLPDTVKERTAGAGVVVSGRLRGAGDTDSLLFNNTRFDSAKITSYLSLPAGGTLYAAHARMDTAALDSLTLVPGTKAYLARAVIDTVAADSLTVIGKATVTGNAAFPAGGKVTAGYVNADTLTADSLTVIGPATVSGATALGSTLGVTGAVTANAGVVIDGTTYDANAATRATGGSYGIVLGGAAGDDFLVDTSVLAVESDNNRVGIGTASPSATFQVYSNTASALPVIFGYQDNSSATGDVLLLQHDASSGSAIKVTGNGPHMQLLRTASIANGDSVELGTILTHVSGDSHGMLDFVVANATCAGTVYLRGSAGGVSEFSDGLGCMSTTKGTAASVNIYWSSSAGNYYLENNIGGTTNFSLFYRGF